MWVPDMNKGKPLRVLLLQPAESGLDDLIGVSFWECECIGCLGRVRFIIDIKTLRQTETRIQGERADKGSGGISPLFQMFC